MAYKRKSPKRRGSTRKKTYSKKRPSGSRKKTYRKKSYSKKRSSSSRKKSYPKRRTSQSRKKTYKKRSSSRSGYGRSEYIANPPSRSPPPRLAGQSEQQYRDLTEERNLNLNKRSKRGYCANLTREGCDKLSHCRWHNDRCVRYQILDPL